MASDRSEVLCGYTQQTEDAITGGAMLPRGRHLASADSTNTQRPRRMAGLWKLGTGQIGVYWAGGSAGELLAMPGS